MVLDKIRRYYLLRLECGTSVCRGSVVWSSGSVRDITLHARSVAEAYCTAWTKVLNVRTVATKSFKQNRRMNFYIARK